MGCREYVKWCRPIAAIVIAHAIFVAIDARSDIGTCIRPVLPSLPTAIIDDTQAEQLLAQTMNYMQSSIDYSKCVRTFAKASFESDSDDDKAQIDSELSREDASRKAYAEQWNRVYSAYLESQLKRNTST